MAALDDNPLMDSRFTASIWVSYEGNKGEFFEVAERLSIGRSQKNDLTIKSHSVSRKHAEIRLFGLGRYIIFENRSRNGTFVNDIRVKGSQELFDGDAIVIGDAKLHFFAPKEISHSLASSSQITESTPTVLDMTSGYAVLVMSDIRDYSDLTSSLPLNDFQAFVADWFNDVVAIVERQKGTIDRIVGDAIMFYWMAQNPSDPSPEVKLGIDSINKMVDLLNIYDGKFQKRFGEGRFRIGVGFNAGRASVVNFGGKGHDAFTIVGDCVNVTARLESLTKVKKHMVLTTEEVALWAPERVTFIDLGEEMVKGRAEPLTILGLDTIK